MTGPHGGRRRPARGVALPVLAATLGALLVAAPASAAEVPDLPAAVTADLDRAERSELAGAAPAGGDAVREVSVVTDDGDGIRVDTVEVRADDASDVAEVLAAQPSVEAAGVARPVRALGDPLRVKQWPLDVLRGEDVRRLTTGRPVVAVVDTGVDGTHPDLDGVLVPGTDLVDGGSRAVDPEGHGTHVAGIVGAEVGNGVGVEGLLADVAVMPVRVLDAAGAGSTATVAQGVVWAVDHGADVVNLSLGGPGSDPALRAAVDYAEERGVVVVAATGNDGDGDNAVLYPAAYPSVLAVGATDSASRHASFSSHGPHTDVAAPGQGVLSTYPGGRYAYLSGTSMATPYAAAVVAAVTARYPGLDPAGVRTRVTATARDLGSPGRDDQYGHGLVDAVAALAGAKEPAPPTVASAPRAATARPGKAAATVTWDAPVSDGGSPITGYRVTAWRSGTPTRVTETGPDARSATVTRLANGRRWVVKVRARTAAGTGAGSEPQAVVPRTVPSEPTGTRVRSGSSRDRSISVRVTWAAPVRTGGAALRGYTVRLRRAGSTQVVVRTVGASTRAVNVGRLRRDATYTATVQARNVAGHGRPSARPAWVPAR